MKELCYYNIKNFGCQYFQKNFFHFPYMVRKTRKKSWQKLGNTEIKFSDIIAPSCERDTVKAGVGRNCGSALRSIGTYRQRAADRKRMGEAPMIYRAEIIGYARHIQVKRKSDAMPDKLKIK